MKKIVVLGAGAWGTVIATLLARNGHEVTLWCFEAEVAHSIARERINKLYFPDVVLPETIMPVQDMHAALDGATLVFEAVPVKYMRSVFENIVMHVSHAIDVPWVFLSKGIEQGTFFVPSQIAQDVFKKSITCAALGGPNFAAELAQNIVTATTIASRNKVFAQEVSMLMRNDYFKPYLSSDPVGVQICGALKNVIALALGIAEGAGYKHENTKAFLLTQGIYEIKECVKRLGGLEETAYGLAGFGDMILTCSSTLSKNLRVGKKIGQGITLANVAQQIPVLPEGINTLQSLHVLMQKWDIELPLCQATYETIFHSKQFAIHF